MINFTYNGKKEVNELVETYSQYDFFKKKKYKVFYPKISDSLEKQLIANPQKNGLKEQLGIEFKPIFEQEQLIYKKTLSQVEGNWRIVENDFFKELKRLKLKMAVEEIKCYVSRYGPGGSFYPYKSISIRAVKEYEPDIVKANEKIAHELVHLAIHKYACQYQLDFENTERLVDLILTKTTIANLLNQPTLQGFGNNKLDTFFDLYPTDAERVIREFKNFTVGAKVKNYKK